MVISVEKGLDWPAVAGTNDGRLRDPGIWRAKEKRTSHSWSGPVRTAENLSLEGLHHSPGQTQGIQILGGNWFKTNFKILSN